MSSVRAIRCEPLVTASATFLLRFDVQKPARRSFPKLTHEPGELFDTFTAVRSGSSAIAMLVIASSVASTDQLRGGRRGCQRLRE